MIYKQTLDTDYQSFTNITKLVDKAVKESNIRNGICVVYSPHTTAGITINENADPDVVSDMLFGLSRIYKEEPEYRHAEGNTTAHLKASFVGSSVTVIVDQRQLILGTWQGIYFCEFDGPRHRTFYVKIIEE